MAAAGEQDEQGLDEAQLASSWLEQFRAWAHAVEQAALPEPHAMVLASAGADGQPSARSVLLKGVDERGFELFTNLESRKGVELAANPRASLLFPWYALRRQVIVIGSVEPVSEQRADEYFASRAHGSRLGALASRQSRVIASRAPLEQARAELQRRYPPGSEVPRPAYWGGLRVVPHSVEFWQGRRDRLHDRLRYRRDGERWIVERLSP